MLTDMSGSTAENSGQGFVVAAKLAVQAAGAPVGVVAAGRTPGSDVGHDAG